MQSVAVGDLNRDGRPDLVVANSRSATVSVLLNLGSGPPTAALISFFQGRWTAAGLELRWMFSTDASAAGIELERGDTPAGPWRTVTGDRHDDGRITILLDPYNYGGRTFASGADPGDVITGRVMVLIFSWIATAGYAAIVWAMYKSMVKNFDMTIRRQSR